MPEDLDADDKENVYTKLVAVKGKDASFSELFERLVEDQSPAEILKPLRGNIELGKDQKRRLLAELDFQREKRRI